MMTFYLIILYGRISAKLESLKQKLRQQSGALFPFLWVILGLTFRYLTILLVLHFFTFILFEFNILEQNNGVFVIIIKDFFLIFPDYYGSVFIKFHFVWSSFILPDEVLIVLVVEEQEFILVSLSKRD